MIFYHASPTILEDFIKSNGLIPKLGERSKHIEDENKVYLFQEYTDLQNALSGWLGEEFEEIDSITLWEVRLPENFPVEPSFPEEYIKTGKSWEFFSRHTISPKFLKILSRE